MKNIAYKINKTDKIDIENIHNLNIEGKKPKAISKILGIDYNTVKYYIYGSRIKNKKPHIKSKNHKENAKRKYYRDKYSKWSLWKADCLISSFQRRHQKIKKPYNFITSRPEMAKLIEENLTTCHYCSEKLTEKNLSIDHKLPVSRGGDTNLENIAFCCKKCNSEKGSMTEKEFNELKELVSNWEDKGITLFRRLRSGGFIFNRKG